MLLGEGLKLGSASPGSHAPATPTSNSAHPPYPATPISPPTSPSATPPTSPPPRHAPSACPPHPEPRPSARFPGIKPHGLWRPLGVGAPLSHVGFPSARVYGAFAKKNGRFLPVWLHYLHSGQLPLTSDIFIIPARLEGLIWESTPFFCFFFSFFPLCLCDGLGHTADFWAPSGCGIM